MLTGIMDVVIIIPMIKSFSSKATKRLFEEDEVSGFIKPIEGQVKRKLTMLHFAESLDDLRIAPGNRLEALKGGRKGQWSIRINKQYRICFMFEKGDAYEVEITDYH
ncbi:Toxin HigB [hydrothermal vent metagenome]|uniref:Toxin HigB n=1 Tax=hydrothermal vent metagenome TaxID=652676 RepID=A0A3B1BS09_9ZZZZ